MDDLAISIMSNYLSDEDLTNSLKDSGLNINVDLHWFFMLMKV